MSRTTVKIVKTDGQFNDIAELGNSWGSAAFVWSALSKKYLGDEMAWMGGNGKAVWDLAGDSRLSQAERIVLVSTFDHAIIEHAHFADAANAFREFSHDHSKADHVNHLPTIARLLDERKDTPCIGMCFHQTSVSEDPWHGGYDEEAEEYKPYDLQTETRHFFVFAEYGDKPEAQAVAP